MNKNKAKENKHEEEQGTKTMAERLDELSSCPTPVDVDLELATHPETVGFMAYFLHQDNFGRINWFEDLGICGQNVGEHTLRCIYLVDHPEIERSLAMLRTSVNCAGGQIQLAPYTVVVPYVERKPVDTIPETERQPGMEVA